jgi:catechol 2,3-dioxygenase-like lactoylglutathione lyase family enzyme
MPVRFRQVIPVLRIFDFPRAKQFYVDFLGFKVDWEEETDPEGPRCMEVSRGGMVLHLSSHHGDDTPGSKIYFDTTGLDQLHREITSRKYKFWRPGIEKNPWGTRSMEVGDPFGNRLFFSERIKSKRKPAKKGSRA